MVVVVSVHLLTSFVTLKMSNKRERERESKKFTLRGRNGGEREKANYLQVSPHGCKKKETKRDRKKKKEKCMNW